jgi:hypothetical protein
MSNMTHDEYVEWLQSLSLPDRIIHDVAFGAAWVHGRGDEACREYACNAVINKDKKAKRGGKLPGPKGLK